MTFRNSDDYREYAVARRMKTIKRRNRKPPMTPNTTSICFSSVPGFEVEIVGSYVAVVSSVLELVSDAVDMSGLYVAVLV